jgi:hypothetical protein
MTAPAPLAAAVEPERLIRDVHPAELLMPDGVVLKSVRVFVTTTRLLAFRSSEHGEIYLAFEEGVQIPGTVPADRGTLGQAALECRLASGETAWINRGQGCGCGSPLKALAPPVSWTGR